MSPDAIHSLIVNLCAVAVAIGLFAIVYIALKYAERRDLP